MGLMHHVEDVYQSDLFDARLRCFTNKRLFENFTNSECRQGLTLKSIT